MHLYLFLQNLLNYLIKSNNLGYVVVDESYCENDWISGPKEEYHALTTLRNTISNIPWIITTAKASLKVNINKITIGFNNFN